MFSIVLTEWPRRELHEVNVISSLAWVSLICNNAGTMVKSKLPLLRSSTKQVYPQAYSEALKYVQNSLRSLCFSPNATFTPHINSFIRNPLPYSISVAILISYGREVTCPLVSKSPRILEPVREHLQGPLLPSYHFRGHVDAASIMPLRFGGLVLGLSLGIKPLRMPHIHAFTPK